jgi:DNA-binding transcriptional MocR family regulator
MQHSALVGAGNLCITVRRHVTPYDLARLLGDWRNGPGPLYARLAGRLGQLLSDGRVAPGVRLPSERRLALELGVSRTTIVRTYAALREQGLLESRRGAGSVTRLTPGSAQRFASWVGVARLGGDAMSVVDLTKASPAADDRVVAALERAASQAAAALLGQHGYQSLGLRSLRAAVAARFESRGVPTSPEQILITAGAQQAIDLVVRTMIRRRETIVVESPTYAGALDSLRLAGARMVSLDVSAGPWELDVLESLFVQTGARLTYLMPDFQNPTGRLMSNDAREELARLCRRHGVTLIVDETLAELALDATTTAQPVAAFEPSDAVLTIGSLSKAVWAGLRVGWIRATPARSARSPALAARRTCAARRSSRSRPSNCSPHSTSTSRPTGLACVISETPSSPPRTGSAGSWTAHPAGFRAGHASPMHRAACSPMSPTATA